MSWVLNSGHTVCILQFGIFLGDDMRRGLCLVGFSVFRVVKLVKKTIPFISLHTAMKPEYCVEGGRKTQSELGAGEKA